MSEEKEITLKEISRRNTITVEEALKDMYEKLYDKQNQIDLLNNSISSLQQRMNSLEQQLIIQKVQLTGLGPSVRS